MKNLIHDRDLGDSEDLPQVQKMRTNKKVLKYRERENRIKNRYKNKDE